jgi:hypothetical protein
LKKSKLLVLLLKYAAYVASICPLFHFFLAFLLLPPYTGYLACRIAEVFNKNDTESAYCRYDLLQFSVASIFNRILSGIFAASAFIPLAFASASVVLVETIMGLVSFREYLVLLGNRVGKSTATRILSTFREVQIAVHNFNKLYEHWVLANTFAFTDLVLIISGYCAIKLWSNISGFGVVFFVNLTIAALFAACYVFTAAGKVWIESEDLIRKLKANPKVGKSRFLRQKLRACAVLRINIGYVNFVERATAGVYLLFSVEQIGSLALMY